MITLILVVFGFVYLLWQRNGIIDNAPAILPFKFRALAAVQSLIIALSVIAIGWNYLRTTPENFDAFIGGFLAISALPKSFEYICFYLGNIVFILSFLVLEKFYGHLLLVTERQKVLLRLGWLSLVPTAIMLGQSITSRSGTNIAAITLTTTILLPVSMWVSDCRKQLEDFESAVEKFYCGILFSVASFLGLELLDQRVTTIPLIITNIYAVLVIVFLAAVGLKKIMSRTAPDIFLLMTQSGVPLLFLYLLPPVYLRPDGSTVIFKFNSFFYLIVWGLIIATYIDMLRRYFRRDDQIRTMFQMLSPLLLLAIAAYFQCPAESWPGIPGDDYHNGETILPWYLLQHFGYLPFADYLPSRGVLNYFNGFLTWLFCGENFSLIPYMVKVSNLFILASILWPLRRHCGNLITILALCAIWEFNQIISTGIIFGSALLLIQIYPENYKNPLRWLIVYACGGLAISIISISDSAVFVIAMIPMALFQFYNAVKHRRRSLYLTTAVSIILAALLCLTPFYRIIYGMIQLVMEQSGAYTLAHCVPLMTGNELNIEITKGIFWLFVRFSWLLVGGVAIFLMLTRKRASLKDNIYWLGYAAIAITTIIMIQRAGGRIDLSSSSRILWASLVYTAILLPFMVSPLLNNCLQRLAFMITWGFIIGLTGQQVEKCSLALSTPITPILQPEYTVDGKAVGFPELGSNFAIAKNHLEYLQHNKHIIDSILTPQETYLDMTHNSTGYAYFQRRPPLRYVSYNYIVSDKQAKRAVDTLRKNPVTLVLIKGRSVDFHEGLLPLRSYWLYRYLMDEYRPFQDIYGQIWMIRRGEEQRLKNLPELKPDSLDNIELLNQSFKDLTIDAYPKCWGNSFERLLPRLRPVMDLSHYIKPESNIIRLKNNEFETSGGAVLSIVPPHNVDSDFLYIEFDIPVWGYWFKINWTDNLAENRQTHIEFWGGGSQFLIPLYSAPGWVKNSHYKIFILTLPKEYQGKFNINRLELFKRQ